jgi:signal transduction histidine kinase
MGADDYLAKPFSARELLARIKAILRRARSLPDNLQPDSARRIRFAEWVLDTAHPQLISAANVVTPLSGAEYRLLRIFLGHPNRVLNRDQLVDLTQESANLPWRVLLALAILLAAVLLLSYIAVRWVTRPPHLLAGAADGLGRDINRPPLPEGGPAEVGRAARAFNTMQTRLVGLIDERTRLLTAMSHDLKTPLTRMRLRAEMLEDDQLREKFEKDLVEMESMVTQTLEFMRGLSPREPAQLVDIMGLLESLQADNEAMGRAVRIDGRVARPWSGAPQLLRRCISNLVDNAVLYGKRAQIRVEEGSAELTLRVRDHGPGIPESEIAKVFEPFYRLESSRSRETGGTGLGLAVARNIAPAHRGDVHLRNHEDGGLEAILTLPWKRA